MHHLEFTETEAKNTTFSNCDLNGSIVAITNFKHVDFSTANIFPVGPLNNTIKKIVFSEIELFWATQHTQYCNKITFKLY
jgi:uncharacterized protein YjbI with pentapeptide repeats